MRQKWHDPDLQSHNYVISPNILHFHRKRKIRLEVN